MSSESKTSGPGKFVPLVLVLALALGACATAPQRAALTPGSQATIEGRVTRIDTAPWAYDGNAIVTVADDLGPVDVNFPARWNLCKAPSVDLQSLKVGQRVRVTAAVSAPGELVVCERAEHGLRVLP